MCARHGCVLGLGRTGSLLFLTGSDTPDDGPPAAGKDHAPGQQVGPRGGSAIEGEGEPGEPLARGGCRVRGCHGWVRPGRRPA